MTWRDAACIRLKEKSTPGLRPMEGSLARAATATPLRTLVPAEGRHDRARWNSFELPAETD